MTAGTHPSRSMPPAAAGLVIATSVVGLLLTLAMADPSGVVFFVAYAGIGGYLAIRRPTNSVAWFLMTIGWGLAVGSVRCTAPLDALLVGRLDGLEAISAWANGTGWGIAFVGFFGITLVFPDGRMPDSRGRWPSRLALGAIVALAGLLAFGPTINVTPAGSSIPVDVQNPLALMPGSSFWTVIPAPGLVFVAMFGMVVVGVLALTLRYRRSVGLERLQYRWLVAAIVFSAVANLIWAVATFVLGLDQYGLAWIAVLIAYPTVPIAIAAAILRHRLYEIDRIVSRTIAYAVVSVVLTSVFAAGVLILSTGLASFAQGQTIAVAGSTLAAYAVFQPVLRRVRRSVDRRFDRARYDGDLTVTAFSARLRNETDLEAVTTDLATTTRSAVAPAVFSLWLRPRDVAR